MIRRVIALAALVAAAPRLVSAQGTLGSQGYGYNGGEASTRSRGAAGALAEFDAASPLNPAAMLQLGRSAIVIQYDPEFRTTYVPGNSTSTSVFRFPLFSAMIALGPESRGMVGVTASSLFDRSWGISDSAVQNIGGDTATYRQSITSRGGMSDVRLGFAWKFTDRIRAGLGFHAIVGNNQVTTVRSFPDSLAKYVPAQLATDLRYWGKAVSVGAEWTPIDRVSIAGSARFGGSLAVSIRDSGQLASGRVPARMGLSVRTDIAKGAQITASATWNGWSAMRSMLQDPRGTQDAWDGALGVESNGPVTFGLPTVWRAGVASRTLPFGVGAYGVKEGSVAGGISFFLGQGRSILDLALSRAARSASGGLSENATTFSIGLSILP
jgi:long-subunit fatty acid transport protein